MTIGDAIRLATDGVIRCLIYVRISMDKAHDGHGVANQMAKLEQRARERGWTVVYRLSDNDIGVTRKDPTKPGKYRPGYEEAMRLVDARMVDAVLCFKWDRFIREPLDLEYLIPRFDKAGVRFAEVDGNIDLGTDSGRLARPHPDRGGQGRAGAQGRAAEAGQRAGRDQRQAVPGHPAPVRVPRGPRDRPSGRRVLRSRRRAPRCWAAGRSAGSCGSGPSWASSRRSTPSAAPPGGTGPASG